MKGVFNRPRPTVVPHLREVFSTSFPSGHAMESAIVYLTLGAMLMRVAERRLTRSTASRVAMLLTFLVGVSRVYLGVHYPTDVLGRLDRRLVLGVGVLAGRAALRRPRRHPGRAQEIRVSKCLTDVCRRARPAIPLYAIHDSSTMPDANFETILLVEDEPAVRQLFAQALKRAGYSVHEARNGQEAMKLFDLHGESIDLLLTDMRMPYMGGAELAHHLRGRRRTLKLLCISGYPGHLDPELAMDFLAKPFSRDDLLKKVREVLDK